MKKILALLLVLCMIVALAACGAAKDEPKTDDKKEDTKKEDTKKEDTKKEDTKTDDKASAPAEYTGSADFDWSAYEGVTVEIMWQDSDDTQIDITENFAKPHLQEIEDEYGVHFDWISSLGSSITTLAATGDLADIWFSSVTMEMINSDVLLDLTPYCEVDTYLADTYNTPDFHYFDGHIWALSTGVDNFYTGTLYYNKTITDELGITAEDISTYDGFVAALQKCKDAGYGGLTFEGGGAGCLSRFLWPNAMVSVDVDSYKNMLAGQKDGIKKESLIQSINDIRGLIDAGFCGKGVSVRTTSDSLAAWGMGDYVFNYVDSWNNGTVQQYVDDGGFELGVAWWPTHNADMKTGDYISGWGSPLSGWSAKADTEYPELVVETIKQILVAEAARHLNAGLGTNHHQTADPVPANNAEELRFEIYNKMGTLLKGWYQNAADGAMQTEWAGALETIGADDVLDVDALYETLDAAWQANTFFG